MKTNLLRIGLRLSLVVIALLCGVHLAWGQENTKVMHKIYTNTYGNVTIDCPSEVEDGGSFAFKIATYSFNFTFSCLLPTPKNSGLSFSQIPITARSVSTADTTMASGIIKSKKFALL